MVQLCDILKIELLKDATIITTTHDPNSIVNGVSIMEAPDIVHWVDSNEIILTNLYSVHQDSDAMNLFVQSLGEKRLCALMIKTGRYFSEVPQKILNAAQQHQIAIILIPPLVRFSELIYHIMAVVFESQVTQLNYFKQTRELFNGIALKNAGINGIIHSFTNIIHDVAIVYDHEMEVLYATESGNWQVNKDGLSGQYHEKELGYSLCRVTNTDRSYLAYSMPIEVLDVTAGYLVVVEKNHALDSLGMIAMQNAAAALSLEMLKDFAVRKVERTFRLDLFDDILLGKTTSSIEERASSIGWRFDKNYTPAIICFSHTLEQDSSTYGDPITDKLPRVIHNTIDAAMKKHFMHGIFESRKHKTILFIEQPHKDFMCCREKLSGFLDELQKQFEVRCPQLKPIHVGYVSLFGDISQMPKLYANSKYAMKIGTVLNSPVCDFEKLGVFKLLCLVSNQEELARFVPQSIDQLFLYDTENQSNLVETLESYFNHNRNHKRAADSLFIHYKTMAYRINKIKEITGIDFKNEKELLEMEIGLQICRIAMQS